ncbi:MAG TPA: hypothetical protein VNJ51_07970 [Candidatus Dormibacteraeota bacterium]|nr:hypothetical protein [Candidatus Dormibacteraeota bacterium]
MDTPAAACADVELVSARGGRTLWPGRPPLDLAAARGVVVRGDPDRDDLVFPRGVRVRLYDRDGRGLAPAARAGLSDGERRRLRWYARVAADERSSAVEGIALPALRIELAGLVFERPASLAGEDLCGRFPPERLRLWPAGASWDGLTRLGDRAPPPRGLGAPRARELAARLSLELRLAACASPLRSLPRAGEIVAVLRRELGLAEG